MAQQIEYGQQARQMIVSGIDHDETTVWSPKGRAIRVRSRVPLLLAVIGLALVPAAVQAQGLISGLVDDALGIGLPGALVNAVGGSAFDDHTVTPLTVTTDAHGQYRVELPPGIYSMRFSLPGFQTVVREHIGVENDRRVPLDMRLRPTLLQEGVTLAGVHPDAAPSSVFDRTPPVRRNPKRQRLDASESTPRVERAPRLDPGRGSIERRLFSTHIENACLGYAPMWLSGLDVVLARRPCQLARVHSAWVGGGRGQPTDQALLS